MIKILESAPMTKSLRIHCGPDHSDSGWVRLECRMSAQPWISSGQTSISSNLRSQKISENVPSTELEVGSASVDSLEPFQPNPFSIY
jgi:hypothetical protein